MCAKLRFATSFRLITWGDWSVEEFMKGNALLSVSPTHPVFSKYMDSNVSMDREDAANILEYVGRNSPSGTYAQDIPPYVLGRAVRRLVFNYFTKVDDQIDLLEQDRSLIADDFLKGFLK